MESTDTAIVGGLVLFFVVFTLIVLACAIIVIVAKWKILEKGGEDGWKAIIPVYGDMVLCKIAGVWFWYPLLAFGISCAIGTVSGMVSAVSETSTAGDLISLLSYVVTVYYTVILSFSLAKSFGKDTGFGVGLLLLGIVFFPILGFGKSEYVGACPINDPIMGSLTNNTTPQAQGKFCPECGSPNTGDSSFCEKCGNKLN